MSEERVDNLARQVELLLMDVDGVMTDGRIVLAHVADGLVTETKFFNAMDGAGIGFARKAGLKTGVITKRRSASLAHRAQELKMEYVYNGVDDKRVALDEICRSSRVPLANICYIGDDLHDLPVMIRVGFPIAVRNAHIELQTRAAYVTIARGGHGAVREVVELILKAQDKWAGIVESFLGGSVGAVYDRTFLVESRKNVRS